MSVEIPDWYEVWADNGLMPPYVLIVFGDTDGKVTVFDPKENVVAHESSSYETAKLWLLEDEYSRVDGRMSFD